MSIRIASILFSILAHGTAFIYLDSFISLDKPTGVETGQGMKVTLVRAEKKIPSMQPQHSIALPDTPVKSEQKPLEYKEVVADSVAVSSEIKQISTLDVDQINARSPTSAGKFNSVEEKVPSTKKRKLIKPRPVKALPPPAQIVAPQLPSKAAPLVVATVAPESNSVWVESRTLVPSSDQSDQLPAIEQTYTQALAEAIERNKHYPLRARKKGQQGEVTVRFTILKDGSISQVQISSSSHFSVLDRAASKAVESLSRFRPIPDQLKRDRWDFQVPVRFAVN
ncbi:energy transducer TonB [Sedimenticola selenatireducens]|uniref:Protein TonB n=1 Tax=Sedimenticola selenatireducens TaxID=191960 RepID=A0A557SEL2_9GAMM|nr:energy transducer TonB [Sedimenticola selenatireducens]TVO75823.1 TonB family protein [Sedimenticola selenatireducens]TVT63682.1 MAG: TonB family protein [Sedimenticola selenatireducens]